jgi:hypothetical protein
MWGWCRAPPPTCPPTPAGVGGRTNHILEMYKKNPYWISAFVCGEGCFTGSFLLDKRATWGMWPQIEFNITQSEKDLIILDTIKQYFGCGEYYARGDGIYRYAVRDADTITHARCANNTVF